MSKKIPLQLNKIWNKCGALLKARINHNLLLEIRIYMKLVELKEDNLIGYWSRDYSYSKRYDSLKLIQVESYIKT